MTCQRCGTRKEMKMSSRRPCPWRTMNGYCLDPGKIRPLTVEDAITIPEVKALVDIALQVNLVDESGWDYGLSGPLAPFLAAMKDKR